MVKKSIIAIALIGMLAGASFAQDIPEPQLPGQLKIDGQWPITCQYTPITICCIPVVLKVGMFVEIVNCPNLKIILSQVNCPSGQSFPCYKGCVNVQVNTNFEVLLKATYTPDGQIVAGNKSKVYFDDGDTPPDNQTTVTPPGATIPLCVEAWDANIFKADPGTQAAVGQVCITAMPTGTVVCTSYTTGS